VYNQLSSHKALGSEELSQVAIVEIVMWPWYFGAFDQPQLEAPKFA
jgi:hypothetical protein